MVVDVVDGCSILANFVWPWVHDLCLKIHRSPTKNHSKSHEFSLWVKSSKSAQLWGEDHRVHWGAPVSVWRMWDLVSPCFSMFLCQFWSHPSRGGREEDPNARVCLSLSWQNLTKIRKGLWVFEAKVLHHHNVALPGEASIPLKQPACVLWTMGPTALKYSVKEQDVNSGDCE